MLFHFVLCRPDKSVPTLCFASRSHTETGQRRVVRVQVTEDKINIKKGSYESVRNNLVFIVIRSLVGTSTLPGVSRWRLGPFDYSSFFSRATVCLSDCLDEQLLSVSNTNRNSIWCPTKYYLISFLIYSFDQVGCRFKPYTSSH